jgi:restriction endonuclease S subunit
MSTVRPNLKAFGYIDFDADSYVASTGFAILTPKNITGKYLYHLLFQDYIEKQFLDFMGKGMYPSVNKNDIERLNIPVPSSEEQNRIVAGIDMEQTLVEPSKKLIEIFAKKIQTRINEIWGE